MIFSKKFLKNMQPICMFARLINKMRFLRECISAHYREYKVINV